MSHATTPARYIRERVFRAPSQTAFATMLGYKQATVSRWESGVDPISRAAQERIRALARERGIKWNDLWFFEVPADDEAA